MPIYEYRCPGGHVTERLRSIPVRDMPIKCDECGEYAERIMSTPHLHPDGTYSYEPNIGSKDAFDRKMAKVEKREQTKKETGKVRLVDEV